MKPKLILLITTLMMVLSACEITPTPTEESHQPTATFTFTPEPMQDNAAPETKEEGPTPTATNTSTPELLKCIELLTPENGAELPADGKVTFTWTALDEAELYILNFIFPDGLTLEFETAETSKNRYMEAFSMHPAYTQGGEHQWNVSALNAAGEVICSSDFFTFTKPDSAAAPENAPQGGGDGNDIWIPPDPIDEPGT